MIGRMASSITIKIRMIDPLADGVPDRFDVPVWNDLGDVLGIFSEPKCYGQPLTGFDIDVLQLTGSWIEFDEPKIYRMT